ncbi:CBS domain containing membrane protein [Methylocella silvestris BL2]|uniref:CBS domain containing membrane protein n=2 Tax=Methylocella silvestris TaxID=199596 RepID=B8ELK3_METSB|nr:CBS domain containing membrane protein [Methylocella silvestris BL2]
MNASDVMVRDVVTVGPDDEIAAAVRLLVDHDVSALPVVDADGRVVGVLSEADLLFREEDGTAQPHSWWVEALTPASILAQQFAKEHGRKVSEVMSSEVISAPADASLADIAHLLEKRRIKRVPIITDGKLVGIVSRSNIMQALASSEASQKTQAVRDSDRELRDAILDKLAEQTWTGFGERNIVVSDGVVHIWGLVNSPEERKALLALAESVPGAGKIADEMIASY